jgi:hypothetical protein
VPLNATRILRDAALIIALLLLNALGTPGALAFFAILLGMLFRSPTWAFKAIAICYLGLMINFAFVPKTLVWTPARLLLPFLAFLRFSGDLLALRISLFSKAWYLSLLAFIATMAVGSILSGYFTAISLLKLFNFWAVVTAILSGTAVLRRQRVDISEWFVSLIFAAASFGVAAVALGASRNFRPIFTSTGELLESTGFNGAFLHPNLHATYATLFVTYLLLVWILGGYRKTWLAVPGIVIWFVFMAWSGSRTSIIASIMGAVALFMYARPIRNRVGWRLSVNVNRSTLVAVAMIAMVGVAIWDSATGGVIRQSIVQFFNKGGPAAAEESLDTEKIFSSRKRLVQDSWDNFQANPLFGIGFGVAKTEAFARMATLFTAPAEKGFLPTAILEEGGILGTGTFVVFLVTFLGSLYRERNVAGIVTMIAFLATNLGEVTIFSPGGAGSFGWVTVGAGMILGDHCWRGPQQAVGARRGFEQVQ